jgi:UMF1 family MFS transporter
MADDRGELFGWTMYDWANSGFQTTVLTVLAGPYLTGLAQQDVGANGRILGAGPLVVTAKSLFPYAIGVSVFLQVFLLPWLGAVADYTNIKVRLLATACYVGSLGACLLFFVTEHRYGGGALLLIVANLAFGASNSVYNSLLNDVASEPMRDKVSSRGYALGYLGGGILLALNLVLLQTAGRLGITTADAVRLCLASAGVWWGGFAIVTFTRLRSHAVRRRLSPGESYFGAGMRQLGRSFGQLRHRPDTLRYLVAYMLYNDGIQTVIAMSSLFLAQELFVARGLPEDQAFLVRLILVIQFVAFFGAELFERVARVTGTRRAILVSLVIWSAIIVYAYGWLETTTDAWIVGIAIAIVLGGSQALSRSLFSRMIPAGHEASFFGVYEISERGTSWIGPLIFGFVAAMTNSYRQAMLSLIVLFIAGMVLLARSNSDARESRRIEV